MSKTTAAQHDPQNPDNCPPKCRECRKATRDESRGKMSGIVKITASVIPSRMDVELGCGHHGTVPFVAGRTLPKRTICPVAGCCGS